MYLSMKFSPNTCQMTRMSTVGYPYWNIECYARYQNTSNTNPGNLDENNLELNGIWKYFFSTPTKQIKLSLENSSHLTVTQNNTILENHAVVGGSSNITVFFSADCMLFVNQLTENCIRRFKIKFSVNNNKSGEESCLHSVATLARFFTIKQLYNSHAEYIAKGFDANTALATTTHEEVTVDKIAEILLKQDQTELSRAYQASKFKEERLDKILHLCLSDPMFPVFVNQVEQHIYNLKK
ncbi:uncharacterized protein LOC118767608 isoform X1 [Octopus sinensis]|uniref:Uncharacterized protein LOC118767608 isoform X1 n=2 Tax=Octopus sinensis TaxID=2607531 RepID=A0A7E6FKR4_9MOLL|nr:uncharacterized protein LOC118767608 isoform X1 [Octopus sinensis]